MSSVERIAFESYGVKIAVEAGSSGIIERVRGRLEFVFGGLAEFGEFSDEDQLFEIWEDGIDAIVLRSVATDEEHRIEEREFEKRVESLLRNRVAELANDHVFIHAGVVALGGKAMILPGSSYAGKTTLVRELLRSGARYFSDDFAVLDKDARVLPFPKPLSVRGLGGEPGVTDVRVKELGADAGAAPLDCGLVFFTEFKRNSTWSPKKLTRTEGLLRIIEHTVPIRSNTEFSLKVLNKLALRAIIAQSYRAEADDVAVKLINYFNRKAIGTPKD